jgi:hypothetical protein
MRVGGAPPVALRRRGGGGVARSARSVAAAAPPLQLGPSAHARHRSRPHALHTEALSTKLHAQHVAPLKSSREETGCRVSLSSPGEKPGKRTSPVRGQSEHAGVSQIRPNGDRPRLLSPLRGDSEPPGTVPVTVPGIRGTVGDSRGQSQNTTSGTVGDSREESVGEHGADCATWDAMSQPKIVTTHPPSTRSRSSLLAAPRGARADRPCRVD